MNKNDVISQAVAAIPAWLSFLEIKEEEQLAILAEITRSEASGKTGKAITDPGISSIAPPVNRLGQEVQATAVTDEAPTTPQPLVDPLDWLDNDAPPPTGEPQAMTSTDEMSTAVSDPTPEMALEVENDDPDPHPQPSPPWSE